MKTNSLLTAVVMIVITSATVFGQDTVPTFDISNKEGSSVYKLLYKTPGEGKVTLRISDKEGVVYSEVLNFVDGFTYPLDFKGMNNGEYTIEMLGRKKSVKKTIVYDVKIPLAYVHVTKQPNEKYMLTIKSEKPSDFTVHIYDRWNNEVFQSSNSVAAEFGSIYNLGKLTGPFTFEVTSSDSVEVVRR